MTITFETLMARVEAGEQLPADDIAALAETYDIVQLGMLADTVRRLMRGTSVTYVRVARCAYDKSFADAVPPAAREVRITGAPDTLQQAVSAVTAARAVAGERTVSGFSWIDVERFGSTAAGTLKTLREAGLDAIAELPLDRMSDPESAVEQMIGAGFPQLRLAIDKADARERVPLLLKAAALQTRFGAVQALNPLPLAVNALRPTTGYDDVKSVAIARLAALDIPTIQVSWLRYGPKLAQVALTFGADDLDEVPATDESPDGRRRAPLEEVRRNIEAAGFVAAERDGRFTSVA